VPRRKGTVHGGERKAEKEKGALDDGAYLRPFQTQGERNCQAGKQKKGKGKEKGKKGRKDPIKTLSRWSRPEPSAEKEKKSKKESYSG